jgi:hypothetical protein
MNHVLMVCITGHGRVMVSRSLTVTASLGAVIVPSKSVCQRPGQTPGFVGKLWRHRLPTWLNRSRFRGFWRWSINGIIGTGDG